MYSCLTYQRLLYDGVRAEKVKGLAQAQHSGCIAELRFEPPNFPVDSPKL